MICKQAIVQEIEARLRASSTVWVALSGGLDSTVLTHIARDLQPRFAVKLVHVNHHLSTASGEWETRCRAQAQQLGLTIACHSVEVKRRGYGVEHEARRQRYAIFEQLLAPDDVMLLAHHRDDVVETVFFRLMRGAGIRGLAAMRQERTLGRGRLLRPLLNHTREELLQYAQAHYLEWVEDESNLDQCFDRNYLRHHVLPALTQRWPRVKEHLAATARWAGEADDLLNEYAALCLSTCQPREEVFGVSIDIVALQKHSLAAQKNLLRFWLSRNAGLTPSTAHLDSLYRLLDARADAQPSLRLATHSIRRFHQRLYLLDDRLCERAPNPCIKWDARRALSLGDGMQLCCDYDGDEPLSLRVDYRSGGERCRPQGRAHSQTLKRLLQEYDVPPWLRGHLPLIYLDKALLAVGDLFTCADAGARLTAPIRFAWRRERGETGSESDRGD